MIQQYPSEHLWAQGPSPGRWRNAPGPGTVADCGEEREVYTERAEAAAAPFGGLSWEVTGVGASGRADFAARIGLVRNALLGRPGWVGLWNFGFQEGKVAAFST